MKLWILTTFYTVSLLILSGCGASPKPKAEPVIDTTLEVVNLTDNGTILDMNAVAFEWYSIKDKRVKGIYVYKASPSSVNGEITYYATVDSRFKTHFVDTEILPDTKYTYYFKTFSKDAESVQSKTVTVNSLPVLESVSWIHSIENMPRSAKIIWRPHTNEKVKAYIIERKTLEDEKWLTITTVQGRLNAEYIDEDLKDNFVYKYRVRALTFDGLVSFPSKIVKIVTKALPDGVSNITATRNLPKQIQLNWEKATLKDFALYYLYRSDKIDGKYELIAKLHNNSFTDEIPLDGQQYFYKISVIDKDELESKFKEDAVLGMTLAKPNAPALLEAKLVNNQVELTWNKVDLRSKSYIVSKRYKKGWFEEVKEEFDGIFHKKFTDSNIAPNTTYYYTVYGVDVNSIKSNPSIEVELKTKAVQAGAPGTSKQEQQKTKTEPAGTIKTQNKDIITPINDLNIIEN
ncbi:hypothetical protein KJ877_02220 [bacterium]|nr:hypothetical protein [bacterium]